MKKGLSVKEIVLFVILVLLISFYLVKSNLDKKISELESQRNNIRNTINSVEPYIKQMDEWEKELTEINQKYSGNPVSIPDYNNINNVIAEMSIIFDEDSSYTINFSSPKISDHIVTRNVTITFSCYNYEEACEKLYQINTSNNRYRITNLDLVEGSNNLYTVNMIIIAYEYSSENKV